MPKWFNKGAYVSRLSGEKVIKNCHLISTLCQLSSWMNFFRFVGNDASEAEFPTSIRLMASERPSHGLYSVS
jgi:hypothetical protein